MMTCWRHGRVVDRYFEGRLDANAEARMRARLARCARCRARYERQLVVEAALTGGDGAPAADRLWRGIQSATDRTASAAVGTSAPRTASARWLPLGAAAVGAAAILIVALPRAPSPMRPPTSPEPVARGDERAVTLPALHVFRSVSSHTTAPLADGATIGAREGLLFAYSSLDPAFTHLMVFAVDSRYGVHWYYPAYLRPGDDPPAIPIAPGRTGVELGEEIRHELPPGPVRVIALFLREPHRVLEIEELVREKLTEPRRPLADESPLLVRGAAQTSIMLRVTP
jgi:hypothetical protein